MSGWERELNHGVGVAEFVITGSGGDNVAGVGGKGAVLSGPNICWTVRGSPRASTLLLLVQMASELVKFSSLRRAALTARYPGGGP